MFKLAAIVGLPMLVIPIPSRGAGPADPADQGARYALGAGAGRSRSLVGWPAQTGGRWACLRAISGDGPKGQKDSMARLRVKDERCCFGYVTLKPSLDAL